MTLEEKKAVEILKTLTRDEVRKMSEAERVKIRDALHLQEPAMTPFFEDLFADSRRLAREEVPGEDLIDDLRYRGADWP